MTSLYFDNPDELIQALEARPEFADAVLDWMLTGRRLVDALERHPQAKETLRQVFLSEAVLKMPEQLAELTERVNGLTEQVSSLTQRLDSLTERVNDLTEQVSSLTVRVERFIANQEQFNARVDSFIAAQEQFNARVESFIANQEQFNYRAEQRFSRMEGDLSTIKNHFMLAKTEPAYIAHILGLTLTRKLDTENLIALVRQLNLPRQEEISFIQADLVFEATDADSQSVLVAAEFSYTGDERDTSRAIRNARLLQQATGQTAIPVIATVRNDQRIEDLIEDGSVQWAPIED